MAAVAGRIADSGANIDRIERMARYPVTAIDLHVSGADPDRLRALLALEAAAQGVDIAVQPASLLRRAMRLIVMDVDSTLIQGEVIELLAAHSGHAAEVAAVTERAMRGELDFEQSLRERVALLAGIPSTALDEVYDELVLAPGARTLVRTLRRLGYRFALVSGGFSQITDRLAEDLGIHYARANELEIVDGVLTGRILGDVVDRAGKAAAARYFAEQVGVPLESVVAIGDGANDLDMLEVAGLGIAYNAKAARAGGGRHDGERPLPRRDHVSPRHQPRGDRGARRRARRRHAGSRRSDESQPCPTWNATRRADARSSSAQSPVTSKCGDRAGREAGRHLAGGLLVAGAVVEELGEVGHRRVVPDHDERRHGVVGLAHQVERGLGPGGVEAVGVGHVDLEGAALREGQPGRRRTAGRRHQGRVGDDTAVREPAPGLERVVPARVGELALVVGLAARLGLGMTHHDEMPGLPGHRGTLAPASLPCHARARRRGSQVDGRRGAHPRSRAAPLMIIGGAEDKLRKRTILKDFVGGERRGRRTDRGRPHRVQPRRRGRRGVRRAVPAAGRRRGRRGATGQPRRRARPRPGRRSSTTRPASS